MEENNFLEIAIKAKNASKKVATLSTEIKNKALLNIANNLKEAEEKNSEASKNIQESITSLNSSKKEAIKIIQDATKESEIQREKMLEETNAQLQEKRLQAQEDIKKEQEKAIKQVHDDVVSLAYQATKSILEN